MESECFKMKLSGAAAFNNP